MRMILPFTEVSGEGRSFDSILSLLFVECK